MADSEESTARTVVKTYVPKYQREEWDEHADELEMSRSEFVRTMVQAGRRGFEGTEPPSGEDEDSADADSSDGSAPEDLKSLVRETLAVEEYHSWEELLTATTEDVERRLEQALQELQSSGEIRHSPRNGGYTLDE